MQPGLHKLFFVFSHSSRALALSVAFATPLENTLHCTPLPAILNVWLGSARGVPFRASRPPSLRSADAAVGGGPSHCLRRAEPHRLVSRGVAKRRPGTGPRSGPYHSSAPCGLASWARAASSTAARISACGFGRCPPFRVAVPRRGTTRASAALRVPPLGRAPRRGCPLSPAAFGGALRSSHSHFDARDSGESPARRKAPRCSTPRPATFTVALPWSGVVNLARRVQCAARRPEPSRSRRARSSA